MILAHVAPQEHHLKLYDQNYYCMFEGGLWFVSIFIFTVFCKVWILAHGPPQQFHLELGALHYLFISFPPLKKKATPHSQSYEFSSLSIWTYKPFLMDYKPFPTSLQACIKPVPMDFQAFAYGFANLSPRDFQTFLYGFTSLSGLSLSTSSLSLWTYKPFPMD